MCNLYKILNRPNMKKRLIIKRAILRKVLNILGVCTVGLIAACAKYGTEISIFNINLKGTVKSNDSLNTIENIQVKSNSLSESSTLTDGDGKFSINLVLENGNNKANLKFSDIDGALNGSFMAKDTILNLSSSEIQSGSKSDIEIKLERDE